MVWHQKCSYLNSREFEPFTNNELVYELDDKKNYYEINIIDELY